MIHETLISRDCAGAAASYAIEQLAIVDDDRRQARQAALVFTSPQLCGLHKAFDQGHEGNIRAIARTLQRAIARDTKITKCGIMPA